MTEPRNINELISQSEAFQKSLERYKAKKLNTRHEPTETERQYAKKVYAKDEKTVSLKYEDLKKAFWLEAKMLKSDYEIKNSSLYASLVGYFSGNGLDQSKGILVMGGTGCGKSLFFKAMQSALFTMKVSAYRIVSCIDAEQTIRMDGEYDQFKKGAVLFDDLGTENTETVVYGNRVNVMSEILQIRYNEFQNTGQKTFITTNLLMEDIEKKYGTRISDRLTEMCNIIIFNWESFRK